MRKRKKFKLGMFVMAIIFAYCAYVAVGQQKILYEKKLELAKLQNKLSDELKTNDELKKQQDAINSDEYIEKAAREMGMVKQGEKVFVDVGK